MAAIGRPVPHRNFDGKIFLERVSKSRFVSKYTDHSNFSDNAIINMEIKMGMWNEYIPDLQINISELKIIFYMNYDLEEAIIDRLEFGYNTKIRNNGNTKYVRLEDDGSELCTKKYGQLMIRTYLVRI